MSLASQNNNDDFKKNYIRISSIVIVILLIIILLQRNFSCDGSRINNSDRDNVEVKIDTVWQEFRDTIKVEVPIKNTSYITPKDDINYKPLTPDENIDTCRARFNYLLKQHIRRTVYQDTIKLDSIGTIVVIDTVWLNKLSKRTYINNYKIPTITITKQSEPTRQVYLGGSIFGNKNSVQLVTPGIMYKDKKDRVFLANVGVNFDGTLTYGAGAYFKLTFKNKK